MINNKKITVVLPAYNAEKTLRITIESIPPNIVDDIILVDDFSSDRTFEIAQELGLHCVRHSQNGGYGANQKTCYRLALERGADIVVMLHPDYQYDPRLIPAMVWMLLAGPYSVVLASRLLVGSALKGTMPRYKYLANVALTFFQNVLLNQHLSEYHTGFRGYHREVLEAFDFTQNSNDFIFDNQFLSQAIFHGFSLGELSCPTKYFEESSSINLLRSIIYGLGVVKTSLLYRYAKTISASGTIFDARVDRQ